MGKFSNILNLGSSDDRLKENEVIIERGCETVSKLKPQESELIAQGTFYDAPGLRHLVNRGDNEFDEEGNEIPLPEAPTSIDPQQDPDYSTWGNEAASANHVGCITYLIKASSELHERVKALEPK